MFAALIKKIKITEFDEILTSATNVDSSLFSPKVYVIRFAFRI